MKTLKELLSETPTTGYDLRKEIAESVGEFFFDTLSQHFSPELFATGVVAEIRAKIEAQVFEAVGTLTGDDEDEG